MTQPFKGQKLHRTSSQPGTVFCVTEPEELLRSKAKLGELEKAMSIWLVASTPLKGISQLG